MRGIVVIDQPTEDRIVGWHVRAGSVATSAWVLSADDPRIERLLTGQIVVTTSQAAPRFGPGANVASLAFAIVAETSAMTAAVHSAPRWPQLPSRPAAGGAQALVRWVSDLLRVWDTIEQERLSCPALVARGGDQPRAFPPGWPAAHLTTLAA